MQPLYKNKNVFAIQCRSIYVDLVEYLTSKHLIFTKLSIISGNMNMSSIFKTRGVIYKSRVVIVQIGMLCSKLEV